MFPSSKETEWRKAVGDFVRAPRAVDNRDEDVAGFVAGQKKEIRRADSFDTPEASEEDKMIGLVLSGRYGDQDRISGELGYCCPPESR